ncbi:MAG TPA: phosphoribosylformylglycinamidine synthase I [Candidatus Eisenbacteria bacterium]|nr:phosphoribosylformylglycinamidine synthase I [Candidatus Eisenbacteria bacterium]
MKPRVAVLQFPGVNCEAESERALSSAGLAPERVPWTAPAAALEKFDAFLLPGGFSYQDRVRAGAIAARHAFVDTVRERAARGVPVLGLCNGAQVLVEAGLVPATRAGENLGAALAPNRMPGRSGYLARWVFLRVEESPCVFTQAYAPGEIVPLPMAHGEGRFVVHPSQDWSEIESTRRVPFRYDAGAEASQANQGHDRTSEPRMPFPSNPNASFGDAAGVMNARGNVLALMPHPERAQSLAQVPLDLAGAWGERRRRARLAGESLWSAGPGAGIFLSLAYALGVREAAVAR